MLNLLELQKDLSDYVRFENLRISMLSLPYLPMPIRGLTLLANPLSIQTAFGILVFSQKQAFSIFSINFGSTKDCLCQLGVLDED